MIETDESSILRLFNFRAVPYAVGLHGGIIFSFFLLNLLKT